MKITDVRTTLLTGPCTNDPYVLEIRKLRSAAFIEIETDRGIIGLGETYAGYFCPEIVPHVVAFYNPILIGQNVDDIPTLWSRMNTCGTFWGRVGLGSIVICGIEAALWDLKGKLEGKPVYELLGGRKHDSLPAYATGGPSNVPWSGSSQKAKHYQRHGFRAAKFGSVTWRTASAAATPIRSRLRNSRSASSRRCERAFGDDFQLALDGHMNDKPPEKMWPRETAAGGVQGVRAIRVAVHGGGRPPRTRTRRTTRGCARRRRCPSPAASV
jgi:galactonate dehydratase